MTMDDSGLIDTTPTGLAPVEGVSTSPKVNPDSEPGDAEKMASFFERLASSLSEEDLAGMPDDLSIRVDEICYGRKD